jgi:hypothetical protein
MANVAQVDAILDSVDDESNPGTVLADLIDKTGAWDWSDGSEHGPEDRLAVVESSGAWWLVYRGSEGDEAERFASEDDARKALKAQAYEITGVEVAS